MNISSGARKLVVSLVCVFMAFLLMAASFPAKAAASGTGATENGEIAVTKRWENAAQLPEAVTLKLLENGRSVSTLMLTAANAAADGSWQGSFQNIPLYDSQGKAIGYTVAEDPLAGYSSSVTQQPRAAELSVDSFGEKVTPASSSSYSIGSSKLVVANKGGDYYVWTLDSLSQPEKEQLIKGVNAAGLQGFGKELTTANTQFAAGLPASFTDGVSLRQSGQATYVEFERTNVWSLFYAGDYTRMEAQGAVIVNQAEGTVVPTPDPGFTEPPSPSAPPKTADVNSGSFYALPMLAALFGLALILTWLGKQKTE